MKYMCLKQHEYRNSFKNTNDGDGEHSGESVDIVGFKWKSHSSIHLGTAIDGLKLIAESARHNPTIKVVRSRRNLIDVFISQEKA